jgi:hypothetical protein
MGGREVETDATAAAAINHEAADLHRRSRVGSPEDEDTAAVDRQVPGGQSERDVASIGAAHHSATDGLS